jgi:hypothetical protein
MFIGVRNALVALVNVLGQFLEMFIGRRYDLFALRTLGLTPSVTIKGSRGGTVGRG